MNPLFEPGLFTVVRPTPTGNFDRAGRPIVEWGEVGGPIDGRLDPLRTKEGEAFTVTHYVAYMDINADLRSSDHLRAGGHEYQVEGAPSYMRLRGPADVDHIEVTVSLVAPVAS